MGNGIIRQHDHALSKTIVIVMIRCNNIRSQNLSRVIDHPCGFSQRDGLLRQEFALRQRKPAPVDGDLDIRGVCNLCRFREGIYRLRSQLKAQGKVQGMGSKFSGCRCLREKGQTCLQVNNTEFHRNHNIPVVFLFSGQVAVVVVRIIVFFHSHFEGGNQLLDPLCPGHRYRLRRLQLRPGSLLLEDFFCFLWLLLKLFFFLRLFGIQHTLVIPEHGILLGVGNLNDIRLELSIVKGTGKGSVIIQDVHGIPIFIFRVFLQENTGEGVVAECGFLDIGIHSIPRLGIVIIYRYLRNGRFGFLHSFRCGGVFRRILRRFRFLGNSFLKFRFLWYSFLRHRCLRYGLLGCCFLRYSLLRYGLLGCSFFRYSLLRCGFLCHSFLHSPNQGLLGKFFRQSRHRHHGKQQAECQNTTDDSLHSISFFLHYVQKSYKLITIIIIPYFL